MRSHWRQPASSTSFAEAAEGRPHLRVTGAKHCCAIRSLARWSDMCPCFAKASQGNLRLCFAKAKDGARGGTRTPTLLGTGF